MLCRLQPVVSRNWSQVSLLVLVTKYSFSSVALDILECSFSVIM